MLREKRDACACVIEVPGRIRAILKGRNKIYVRDASCRFNGHVKVLQCYRCLGFWHLARDFLDGAHCAHCSGDHETVPCKNLSNDPCCYNCKNIYTNADRVHSALDRRNCEFLSKRIDEP